MIYGLGTDITIISRIERSVRRKKFLEKVYSERERELFANSKPSYPSLAANFCGKEAFLKSLGLGILSFNLDEIAILRYDNGQPYIQLSGDAKEYASQRGLSFAVSLSHTGDYAIATVIAMVKE